MPWLKKAGEMPRNEKIWELSDPMYRLYDGSLHYCAENLTDGHLPTSRITALTPKPATKPQVEALVVRQLWHRLPHLTCKSCIRLREIHQAGELPKTGYIVHDFLEYNPSKAEWQRAEARRLALASLGGQARAAAPRTGGRFTSQETSRDTSGTAGNKDEIHQPGHQPAAGENSPSAPASGPAVAPAPYPVLRPPSSGSIDPVPARPEAEDEPFADVPLGADRSRDRVRRGGVHHVGGTAASVLAAARGRAS